MILTGEMVRADAVDQKDLWGTPLPLFHGVQDEIGIDFTLDSCAVQETAKVPFFYSPDNCGLYNSWSGHVVFSNPPYSRGNIDKWVQKSYQERGGAFIVSLLPVSTSADWYQKYIAGKQEILFINKRVRFINAPYTAPFSSMFVIWNDKNIHRGWNQPKKTRLFLTK